MKTLFIPISEFIKNGGTLSCDRDIYTKDNEVYSYLRKFKGVLKSEKKYYNVLFVECEAIVIYK